MSGQSFESLILSIATQVGLDILVKATALLILAVVTTLLLRHRSAAARSVVWSTALGILILLPILSLCLPSWQMLKVPLHSTTEATIQPQYDDMASGTLATSTSQPSETTLAASTGEPETLRTDRQRDLVPAVQPAESSTSAFSVDVVAGMLLFFWLCGSIHFLGRLGVHCFRVHAITWRANTYDLETFLPKSTLPVAARHIGRFVKLAFSDEISIPFSWGLRQPFIVLPSAAKQWSTERLRSVLLHELGHIARRDYVAHMIVEVARALYWPNPLVWLAAQRNAMERERACDDFALSHGAPSQKYATHLLEIARSQIIPQTPLGATSLAGKRGLVERIGSIMNKKLDRSQLRPTTILVTICLAIIVAIPLSAIKIIGAPLDRSPVAWIAQHFSDNDEGRWQVPTTREAIAVLRDSNDSLERQRAAWWLGEHERGSGVDPLIEALADQDVNVQIIAGWALGEIKDRSSISALIETLDDNNFLVREMAVLALGEIESHRAEDALRKAFEREKELGQVVVWALGEIGGSERNEVRDDVLAEWGHDPWPNEQVFAGTLEIRFPRSRDIPKILDDLRDRDADTRRLAALNLAYLGMKNKYESTAEALEAVDGLLGLLNDPEPEVRAAAIWSLDEINPSRSAPNHRINHRHDHG